MTRKTKEIIIAVTLLMLLIIVVFLAFGNKEESIQVKEDIAKVEDVVEDVSIVENVDKSVVIMTPEPIARTWVERFGSFSSESDFKNIEDIYPLSTAELQSQLSNEVSKMKNIQSGYYGISTQVINIDVIFEDELSSELRIKTQRVESIDSPENQSTRYQDIHLTMVKNGGEWLVSSYVWE